LVGEEAPLIFLMQIRMNKKIKNTLIQWKRNQVPRNPVLTKLNIIPL
jgi:hypothetical protein